ncbi:hypothetical protein SAMN05444374_107100 [Rhodococcoides kroppenstedtii]|uniref:Uncharacterized protein n=1 Tax=Rhodococcoides kroppenstedtii TaxID=293050 RepID=A0A1I0TKE6_9NOCA|nr:hypothetical protein SAMN05444374_107100 [Rhodococcus kroppenstedtii]
MRRRADGREQNRGASRRDARDRVMLRDPEPVIAGGLGPAGALDGVRDRGGGRTVHPRTGSVEEGKKHVGCNQLTPTTVPTRPPRTRLGTVTKMTVAAADIDSAGTLETDSEEVFAR